MSSLFLVPLLAAVSGSCQGADCIPPERYTLERFLPGRPGHVWIYWGFAEYGHRMRLDEIADTEEGRVYRVTGMVEDVSDGESSGDFSLALRYTVTDSSLSVFQRAPLAMDNDFESLELLRLPLSEGSSWTQTATFAHGSETLLICQVTEADGGTVTVRYSDTESPFYQIRVFEEGLGVTAFEKLYLFPEGDFEMGYFLYRGDDY